MMVKLEGPSHAPAAGGAPRQLVILLHGVGADGNDLIGLAPYWSRLLPQAAFIAPNAPYPCDMAPYGYQWFSLQDRTPSMIEAGVRATAPILTSFIDERLAELGLTERGLALVGFSQGTMMSLFTAPRRPQPVAGVLGFSGALVAPESLAGEIRSRPRTFLVHGDADEIVPFEMMGRAEAMLRENDVPVETLRRPGLGHESTRRASRAAARFCRRCSGE
jgi:phospholipase/carboxylesterase